MLVVVTVDAPTVVAIGVAPTEVTIAVAGRIVVVEPPFTVPVITTPAVVVDPGTVAPGATVTGALGVPTGVSRRAKPVVVVVAGARVVDARVVAADARVGDGRADPSLVVVGPTPAGGMVARVLLGAVVGATLASAGALDFSGTGAPSSPPNT